MQFEAIKLRFSTPVHIGKGRDDLDDAELVYHSDSLRAAIYSIGVNLFPEWNNAENYFNSFKVSSCFPFAHDDYFLPKPFLKRNYKFKNTNESKVAKKQKKIAWINHKLFSKIIQASESEIIEIDETLLSENGEFICSSSDRFPLDSVGKKQNSTFYKSAIQQRVIVEEERDSTPFYVDRIYFAPNCGLYFLAQFENDNIRNQINQVIAILANTGIGTDRSVGNGLFEFNPANDIATIELPIGDQNSYLSLGLYLPSESEFNGLELEQSYWHLQKRGGYMAGSSAEHLRHLRKKSVFMVTEGSVLTSKTKLNGKYVNIRPEYNDSTLHDIWRDGQCIMLQL